MVPRSSPSRLRRRLAAALAVALAVGLAGCGSGADRAGVTTSSGQASSSSSSTASTSRTTTTSGSRSAAAALPGTGRPTVTIGDKNYTEQFVLGQLYLQALLAQGFTVNISQTIGPPGVIRQALAGGTLAMYPEYLNVFDTTIADRHTPVHSLRAAYRLGEAWAARHGLRLLTPTRFGDTDGIAVTDAFAAAHRLRGLADLTRVAGTLAVGGAVQFRGGRTGLPGLSAVYGVSPAAFRSLAVGDQYDALDMGTVQAAYVNTTDGQLASGDYRVLGDPRRMFGWGNVVPVISRAVELKEGPAFAATIERVDRTLTLPAMRQLNLAAANAGEFPKAVALQYLQTHGLLGPLTPSDYALSR